jgi:hypothetical protein
MEGDKVTNRNKNNGSRYEREFSRLCQDAGLVAMRIPLSGAMRGYPGDVIVSDEILIECKYRKGGDGFKRLLERVNSRVFCDWVEVSGLRAMTLTTWIELELGRVNGEERKIPDNIDRPKWTTEFAFVHAAFDQGECAAHFVACRMQKASWIVIERISEVKR